LDIFSENNLRFEDTLSARETVLESL
jgi:hypothetical protein